MFLLYQESEPVRFDELQGKKKINFFLIKQNKFLMSQLQRKAYLRIGWIDSETNHFRA